MKKPHITVLILTTLVFLAFSVGYYFGNQHNYIVAQAEGVARLDVPPPPTAYEPITTVQPVRLININTATAEELDELPGIGETLSHRIVEYRKANGPFERIDALCNVKGIGLKMVMEIADLITVGGTK